MDRRTWLRAALAGGATMLTVSPLAALRRAAGTKITVYKSPSCGCCKAWVTYIEERGFSALVHDVDDVTPYKKQYHVPDALQSCHTAVVGDYVIEGHVPADLIHKVLKEKPAFLGLATPGMPQSAPGMDMGKVPYDVIAFTRNGKTSVYAKR
jgi:hypothetical protein